MRTTFTAIIAACLLCLGVLSADAQRTSKTRAAASVDIDKTMRFERTNAYTDGSGVWVSWQLNVYARPLGFEVYRITSEGRQPVSYTHLTLPTSDLV